jgi:glycosyltransferase involved in cell wall biosynthesis
MRPGDKLASYRMLAQALARLTDRPWQLLVIGDGAARAEVTASLALLGSRATLLGAIVPDQIPDLLAAADLKIWPALNEAWSMALLEAQAAGLPVVAGRAGGVPAVVADRETGLLVPAGNTGAFAEAVAALLDEPLRRRAMGEAAARRVVAFHDLPGAARRLAVILGGLG